MKKNNLITPRYAGIMWCLGFVTVGAITTTLLFTIPYIGLRFFIVGKLTNPSWTELRIIQLIQIPLVYIFGWVSLKWYFPRTYSFNPVQALPYVKKFRFIPIIVVGIFGATVGAFAYIDKLQGIQIFYAILTFLFLSIWDAIWCFIIAEKSFVNTYKIQ